MCHQKLSLRAVAISLFVAASALVTHGQSLTTETLWQVGSDDNNWPGGQTGGGPAANFLQESGATNPLPGTLNSDNDYYFSGIYDTLVDGNGDYSPIGNVDVNEDNAERAFVPNDTDWRVHFNLPADMKGTDLLTVQFDFLNIDNGAANSDPRFGVEVYVNGVKVQDQILVRTAQLNRTYKTAQFTLAAVNGQVGPGFDNIVTLKGIPYDKSGGGSWLGIDYVQLNKESTAYPAPIYPWQVGKDDNTHAVGDGGGVNTTFVQENGNTNPLPGNPNSPEVDQQADDDYYFAGDYEKTIASVVALYGAYTPIGVVPKNEEAAERAVTPTDTEKRYHFNLPNTTNPSDRLSVTFEPLDLDTSSAGITDARFGMEVYINGIKVMPEAVIRPADLKKAITTAPVTFGSVNAQFGSGYDNIVTLKGIPHNTEGGGNWMGLDYVNVSSVAAPPPPPTLIWAVGANDNQYPVGNGGGASATFVQENGSVNALPGTAFSPEVDQQADNDYYLAGVYNTTIAGNGTYAPVGIISVNEEAAERALTTGDNLQRYHFNLPASVLPTDQFTIQFDAMDLDQSGGNPKMGVEVYVNSVKVMDAVDITNDKVGQTITVPPFTAGSVNIKPGAGFDNIVMLKGISHAAEGGGDWMGIDYIQFSPIVPPPFPWNIGKADNANSRSGLGGADNATFWQENGSVQPLPGSPYSLVRDQNSDNDYYLAGVYNTVIPEYAAAKGDYTPVGTVLVNEAGGERAFAGGDNELRYHFNLPGTLKTTDKLIVTYDFLSLDNSGGNPHWGVEVYFNDVKVQDEKNISPTELNKHFSTDAFALGDAHAQMGSGFDNVVTLKGISYNTVDGGGNWMGLDFVQLDLAPTQFLPVQIGKDDDTHITTGTGGGPNANFVQENGNSNALPGNPANINLDQQADDDYYMAGFYANTIPLVTQALGDYTPVGTVTRNEEAAERAFVPTDTIKRYHMNLPANLKQTDTLTVTFGVNNFDDRVTATDPHWDVQVSFNAQPIGDPFVIHLVDLNTTFKTAPFTLASVGAQVGPGYDNIVTLQGTSYSAEGGGDWMGIDYVTIDSPDLNIKFLTSTVDLTTKKITLTWSGNASLQSASSVSGPWTTITTATTPFTEDIVNGQNRFYRLFKP